MELPLNGQSADPGEYYIKIANEYLGAIASSEFEIELRMIPTLGYRLGSKHKIEIGLDYRLGSILTESLRHSYWNSINWYIEL